MLIFAFGVLGLIGLLGSSLRVTNDARYRAEAANLASAMIADMWTMTAEKMDAEFGTDGPKLKGWQAKAQALLPSAAEHPPKVEARRPASRPRAAMSSSRCSGSCRATRKSTSS